MKKLHIILIAILVLIILAIGAILLIKKYQEEEVPPPSSSGTTIEKTDVETAQEIKDIDRFLETYGFDIVDTPIKEVIFSNTESKEIKSYYQAVLERNPEYIKDFKVPTAIFEATEIEEIATREMVKDVSIYYKYNIFRAYCQHMLNIKG